jgi:hypothetical protein
MHWSAIMAELQHMSEVIDLTVLEGACKQVKQVKPFLPAFLIVQPNAVLLRHACSEVFLKCPAQRV